MEECIKLVFILDQAYKFDIMKKPKLKETQNSSKKLQENIGRFLKKTSIFPFKSQVR